MLFERMKEKNLLQCPMAGNWVAECNMQIEVFVLDLNYNKGHNLNSILVTFLNIVFVGRSVA